MTGRDGAPTGGAGRGPDAPTAPRGWRVVGRHALPVALLLGLGAFGAHLVPGPSHSVRNAAACTPAYAAARTWTDTLSVDRRSFRDSTVPRGRSWCGRQRAVRFGARWP